MYTKAKKQGTTHSTLALVHFSLPCVQIWRKCKANRTVRGPQSNNTEYTLQNTLSTDYTLYRMHSLKTLIHYQALTYDKTLMSPSNDCCG